MRIMAEEESGFFSRLYNYIAEQEERKVIPKQSKKMLQYLRELICLLFGEDSIVSDEHSQNSNAVWAKIVVEYSTVFPMNGMYQSNANNRVIKNIYQISLFYWKDDSYHSISMSDMKANMQNEILNNSVSIEKQK